MSFRPLLAEKVDLPKLQYPVFGSPKYDGFRCTINAVGTGLSRNMKPIANGYVAAKIQELNLPKFDGELLTYTGNKVDIFDVVQSKLTTRAGMPDFKFMVFDNWANQDWPYVDRNESIEAYFGNNSPKRVEHVQQKLLHNEEEVLDYEAEQLALGWEGIMLRSLDGHYKNGRSTTREGILLKLKRFFDAEAKVVAIHEQLHNANEATINELGYTERSSHKANMHGMGVLGKLTVRWGDVEFDVGTGFNDDQRSRYWTDDIIGKTITFKYQSLGQTGKPRFPVFRGFRDDVEAP